MNKISMDKKYKTRSGLPVRVLCVDRKNETHPVVAMVLEDECFEEFESYTEYGCYLNHHSRHDYDLIEVSPYDDFKKDDKVMVRDFEGEEWLSRYFAYVDEYGVACTYTNGRTSWTADNDIVTSWNYCRKPTQEELGE